MEGCFQKKFLSYGACSQFWLDFLVGHCHLGYDMKLPRKNTGKKRVVNIIDKLV
jgi:hypothetical protein